MVMVKKSLSDTIVVARRKGIHRGCSLEVYRGLVGRMSLQPTSIGLKRPGFGRAFFSVTGSSDEYLDQPSIR